jgi:hypothetical protein
VNKTSELLSRSFFSQVPFHPVPREEHAVWAGSTETRNELVRIVDEVKHDSFEVSHLALVYGEYGSGKTHALKFLKNHLDNSNNIVVSYLEKPKVEKKASFYGIAQEIIKQIGERPLRRAAEPFVSYIKSESKRLAVEGLDSSKVDGSLDEYVKKQSADIKRSLQERFNPRFPELLELFEGLVDEDPAAWRYFTGKPAANSLHRYSLTGPMEDDHDALRALSGIYNVLTKSYSDIPESPVYDAAYIFIDEMEGLLEMKFDEVISVRTGLRDLFNLCTEHFCMILAATAENASLFHGLLEEAMMVRITAEPVHIVSHDTVEDGVKFISDLMANFRSGAAPSPWHPFTESALKAIVDRTGLPKTARKLITNSRRAWEQNAAIITSGGAIDDEDIERVAGFL